MAEAALFSVAAKLLLKIASPAVKKAYKKVQSIRKAREDLDKLAASIRTIQARLLDAEKRQESSATIKDWIKRVKQVFYEAEDLFDEIATDDTLKRITEASSTWKDKAKTLVAKTVGSVSSNNSIANRVKAIRESLHQISMDMEGFQFVICFKEDEPTSVRRGQDPGCFVDPKNVIGRDEDKRVILEMLLNESDHARSDAPVAVIAIVGIGGMGKTTLAQLVYNDPKCNEPRFDSKWFACISNTSDEREVLGRIFQSITDQSYSEMSVGQLQTRIRKSVEGRKFLLVLDDVWDDHHGRWQDRMSLLSNAAKGSKILVTTRLPTVSKAVDAFRARPIGGLSENESWSLFKRVAFTPEQEQDQERIDLGREIVKKCRSVPLAINSIGSLLFEKNTIREWESIKNEELPTLGQSYEDGIMPVLKLSYDHLCSNLKQCFAYCSLFPKNYTIDKFELTSLWIAQEYIKENDYDVAHSNFMCLLRRGFLQEEFCEGSGRYKMHDLIHDLAQHVAGEESVTLTTSSTISSGARHVSTGDLVIDAQWAVPTPLLDANGLRSWLVLRGRGPTCNPILLDHLFANFKRLRALKLRRMGIKLVPGSIGELKLLRYLDLSDNDFRLLPASVTNLVNLIILDISKCRKLKALPNDLRKLVNLRELGLSGCWKLKHMPPGMEEMTCLQYLSDFKAGKAASQRSGLVDFLGGWVQRLRGSLWIEFENNMEDWDGDEGWELPVCLEELRISNYPGKKIPGWGKNINVSTNKLACLTLVSCGEVTHLPPLRHLPHLKKLSICNMGKLEYMEDGDACTATAVAGAAFFPCLEVLQFFIVPKLKGWSREVATTATSSASVLPSFPVLSMLRVSSCPELKSLPLCPRLRRLELDRMHGSEGMQTLLTSTTQSCSLHLQWIDVSECNTSHLTLPKLKQLSIKNCPGLKELHFAHPDAVEVLEIRDCDELELWESQDEMSWHLDWDSLTSLGLLRLDRLPPPEKLPGCIRRRQALGQLQVKC